MNERAEYFAILAALCVTEDELSPQGVTKLAHQIWEAGDRVCKERRLTNEEKVK